MDYIIRATASDGSARAFFAVSTETANAAAKIHETSPVVSAALGRTLTAAALMGAMQKGDEELVTVSIKSDGPIGGILVTADNVGNVKGYPGNSWVELPLNSAGKLDVSEAVGQGTITVIKDIGLKEPYVGRSELISGEIAEDIAFYYYISEQIPTAVMLGVLVDTDMSVKQSGGFIVQMLPGASEEDSIELEKRVKEIPPVTKMLEDGMSPEDICALVFPGGAEIHKSSDLRYNCGCDYERIEKVLISLGKEDLTQIYEEDGKAEICCHFCKKAYQFSKDDLARILTEASGK